MEKEVKNRVKADLITISVVTLGTLALSGLAVGIAGIKCYAHNRKAAKELWNSFDAHNRNVCRRAWVECGKNPETFANECYRAIHADDPFGIHFGETEEKERLKIAAKHLKKCFETPMELE